MMRVSQDWNVAMLIDIRRRLVSDSTDIPNTRVPCVRSSNHRPIIGRDGESRMEDGEAGYFVDPFRQSELPSSRNV